MDFSVALCAPRPCWVWRILGIISRHSISPTHFLTTVNIVTRSLGQMERMLNTESDIINEAWSNFKCDFVKNAWIKPVFSYRFHLKTWGFWTVCWKIGFGPICLYIVQLSTESIRSCQEPCRVQALSQHVFIQLPVLWQSLWHK